MRIWLALACSLAATSAQAKTVEICNYSTEGKVYVAYSAYVDGNWWVQGWRHIMQGECSDFYHEGSSFYYYAKGGNGDWSGTIRHCVLHEKFKILDGQGDCHNGDWKYFKEKGGLGDFKRVRLTD